MKIENQYDCLKEKIMNCQKFEKRILEEKKLGKNYLRMATSK